jgi:ABC-type dipeptide/oligopeptide/nickel transport system permease subunit
MSTQTAAAPGKTPAVARLARSSSLWRDALRHLLHNRSAQIGLAIIALLFVVAMFAPIIATHDPVRYRDPKQVRTPPCIHILGCPADQPQYIFGLDSNGRDLFSRVVYGAQVSLFIGLATVTFAILIGTLLGALSGFMAGWVDNTIMRFMDVLLAFPSLLLAIALVSVLRPIILEGGLSPLIPALFAISFVAIPVYARIVRSSVLSIKEQDFVLADQALGVPRLRILYRTILPNSLTPLIVTATLGIATAILDAAALGFLGLGQQPPDPEWGAMLSEERNSLTSAPHLLIFPGMAIVLSVLAFNLLGDGLRDALDPRLNK